jgi:hypothetical protein
MVDLPSSDSRTTIVGATGSGKTQAGVWLLSTRDYHLRPWFILDYKGDKLIHDIDMIPFNFGDPWPIIPGLYRISILPGQEEEISDFFLQAYTMGHCGIYIDEGMALNKYDRWVKACLTQGRSKFIEIIFLTQRPANVAVEFFSEASFLWIFNLNVKADKQRIYDYTDGIELTRLPRYHSLWYDVALNESVTFQPVPSSQEIVKIFSDYEEEKQEELKANDKWQVREL